MHLLKLPKRSSFIDCPFYSIGLLYSSSCGDLLDYIDYISCGYDMKKARVVDIEQQIAHLRWLRQQNERSIRQTIESSKILKQKDTILGLSVDQTTEKNMWTTKVVKDELTRPLVINDEELYQIQYDENRIKLRLHKVSQQVPFC